MRARPWPPVLFPCVFALGLAKEPDGRRLVLSLAREQGGEERSAVLVRGLRFVQFEYLAEPPPGLPRAWRSRWDARDGLPRAVRVRLAAEAGTSAPEELYFTPRLTGIRPEPPG